MSEKEAGAELKTELEAQQGDTQMKKKAKTTMMWHDVKCEGSEEKKQCEGVSLQF